jgi:hypothetical protein
MPSRALRLVRDVLGGEVIHEGRDELRGTTGTYVTLADSVLEYAVPDVGTAAHADWLGEGPERRVSLDHVEGRRSRPCPAPPRGARCADPDAVGRHHRHRYSDLGRGDRSQNRGSTRYGTHPRVGSQDKPAHDCARSGHGLRYRSGDRRHSGTRGVLGSRRADRACGRGAPPRPLPMHRASSERGCPTARTSPLRSGGLPTSDRRDGRAPQALGGRRPAAGSSGAWDQARNPL